MKQRIALGIEYDGTHFHGWQIQPKQRTVQAELENALSRIAASPIQIIASGRTDAGVHASGQVLHFDTEISRPDPAWVLGTNAELPADVRVHWMRTVPSDFHARYSAIRRTYHYWLHNYSIRSSLWQHRVTWFYQPLNIDLMRQASLAFVGERDFSALRSTQCQAKNPVRTVSAFEITQYGDFIHFSITANAFLHHMIRNIVGVLCAIGIGKRSINWAAELLASLDPQQCDAMALPHGLYLVQVEYPERYQLPSNTSALFPCFL